MTFNFILTIIIAVVIVYLLYSYIKGLDDDDDTSMEVIRDESDIDLKYMVNETAAAFARTLKKNINDDKLTEEELIRKRKRIANMRENLSRAAYGDDAAKEFVKNNIKDLLSDKKYEMEENINKIIPFDKPDHLTSTDRFEIVLFAYNKKYGADGFSQMMEEWNLTNVQKRCEEDGNYYYMVTNEEITMIYDCLFSKNRKGLVESKKLGVVTLDFNDKLDILTQKIFENYIGLGPVDMLINTTVDEIDAGVSGVPKGSFNLRTKAENMSFSYESIWVTYRGRNIHLKCLSFGTQQELVRVCNNIYKYDAPYALSRSKGYVASTMIDGSRIVVVRPPFADSYAFFLRKFDSTPSVAPTKLITDENKVIPIIMQKWLIRGHRTIAITGSQGTGKSTHLKSNVRYIPTEYNIRLQELMAELNLRHAYPNRNIVAFQETESITAQDGLNLQKKTNGAVNIIGEVANAIQASHIIQTAMVASLFAMFTHHAKTAADLVEAIANNLLEMGLYKDKKDAVAMAAKVLNIDCHLTNVKGKRYLERITEIIPQTAIPYPTDKFDRQFLLNYAKAVEKAKGLEKEDAMIAESLGMELKEFYELMRAQEALEKMDAREYYRRTTDPQLYRTVDLVKWYPLLNKDGSPVIDENTGFEKGIFKLECLPSEGTIADIKSKLSVEEEKLFDFEMAMLKRVSDGDTSEEVQAWINQVLEEKGDAA